jgi:hypothetical protein
LKSAKAVEERGADTRDLVRGHCGADPRAVDRDAEVRVSARDRFGDGARVVGPPSPERCVTGLTPTSRSSARITASGDEIRRASEWLTTALQQACRPCRWVPRVGSP